MDLKLLVGRCSIKTAGSRSMIVSLPSVGDNRIVDMIVEGMDRPVGTALASSLFVV